METDMAKTVKQVYMNLAESTDYAAFYFLRNCEMYRANEHCANVIVESITDGINEMDYCYDPNAFDSVY
jgi:hypothetical protein